jgi:sugar lactone lactonase YvrE
MTWHAGLGNGRLAAGVRVGGGWQPMSRLLPARDLARDGRPDLLALDGQGRLWLYPGNGRGGFLSRTLTNPGTSLTTRIF